MSLFILVTSTLELCLLRSLQLLALKVREKIDDWWLAHSLKRVIFLRGRKGIADIYNLSLNIAQYLLLYIIVPRETRKFSV